MRKASPTLLLASALFIAQSTLLTAQVRWRNAEELRGGTGSQLVSSSTGSLFLSTASSVFRSTDDGLSWDVASTGLPRYTNPHIIATRNGTLLFTALCRTVWELFRSTDDGGTWSNVSDNVVAGFEPGPGPVAIDSATGDVFVCGSRSVHRSTDDGRTWSSTAATVDGSLLAAQAGDLFVVRKQSLYRLDSRNLYDTVRIPLPNKAMTVSYCFNGRDMLAYLSDSNAVNHLHYRTRDAGRTWQPIEPAPMQFYWLQPIGDGTLFGFGNGLYRSTDGGDTWQLLAKCEGFGYFTDVTVSRRGTYVATRSLGVMRSTDQGVSWHSSDSGLASLGVLRVAARRDGAVFVHPNYTAPDSTILYRTVSEDRGETWRVGNPRQEGLDWRAPFFFDEDGAFYGSSWGGLYRTTDLGRSWDSLGPASPGNVGAHASMPGRIVTVTRDSLLLASTDRGETWHSLPSPPGRIVEPAAVLFAPDGALLLSMDQLHLRTTDMGTSWHRTGLVATTGALLSDGRSNVYMISTDGIFRSPDGYRDWVRVHGAFPFLTTVELAVNGPELILRYNDSIAHSTDRGETWRPAMVGLERQVLRTVASDQRGRFFIGTLDGGLYISDVPSASIPEPSQRDASWRLLPQPATDVVTLVGNDGAAAPDIAIVSIHGQTLLDASATLSGSPHRRFDLRSFRSGLYVVRIAAGSSRTYLPLIIQR